MVTPEHEIILSAVVGHDDLSPHVRLEAGEYSVDFTPQEARALAANLFECAAAAESDSFLLRFLGKKATMSLQHKKGLLALFRGFRTEAERDPDPQVKPE